MNENTSKSVNVSIPASTIGIIFLILRLCGVIAWPWVWVLAPFWMPIALVVVVVVFVFVIGCLKALLS